MIERLAVAHHDRADANHRMRGVFSGHMKSHTEYLTFNIPARVGFENITPKVDAAVRKSGVKEGLVLVNAMHITASVFINDDESGLHKDYAKWLETLAPFDASPERYAHNRTGEDNADAHMKRQIMGREVVVAITKGQLDFGPWEQIFYGEFDGKRNKRVLIKVIGMNNTRTTETRSTENFLQMPVPLSSTGFEEFSVLLCFRVCVVQRGSDAAALRSAGANSPAANCRMPAAAIIAALSVESDSRGM